MIILLLMSALILRPFAFFTIDSIIIARLVTDVSGNKVMEMLWNVVRVFINPPRDLIEVSLISYMLLYQDNRNRADSFIAPNITSINDDSTQSLLYFGKTGIPVRNDLYSQNFDAW